MTQHLSEADKLYRFSRWTLGVAVVLVTACLLACLIWGQDMHTQDYLLIGLVFCCMAILVTLAYRHQRNLRDFRTLMDRAMQKGYEKHEEILRQQQTFRKDYKQAVDNLQAALEKDHDDPA